MIPTRRLLAGAAAGVVCALLASGCDTSPVAVSVNSQNIQQTAVNADLRAYTENQAYVSAFDSSPSSQASGVTVGGSAPGTYNARFVAGVLDDQITAAALHQYLAAHRDLPGPALVAAVRGWDAARYGSTWVGFPAWFRSQTALQDAEEAQFVTVDPNTATLRKGVVAAAGFLFSEVCVREAGFSARTASGQIDYPASLDQARQAVVHGSLRGGAVICYTPARLEAQGQGLYHTVVTMRVGQVTAPQRTTFGYERYAVVSRTLLPFDAAMRRAATLVEQQSNGAPPPAPVTRIVASARVHLNPQYGTWDPRTGVTPPAVPAGGS